MFLYVELWKPRPEWENLAAEQREEFLSQLVQGTARMTELGVELLGFGVCEEEVLFDAGCRYMAVWKMANLGHAHMLEKAVRAEGWENYFDILHARGKIMAMDQFVAEMVKV